MIAASPLTLASQSGVAPSRFAAFDVRAGANQQVRQSPCRRGRRPSAAPSRRRPAARSRRPSAPMQRAHGRLVAAHGGVGHVALAAQRAIDSSSDDAPRSSQACRLRSHRRLASRRSPGSLDSAVLIRVLQPARAVADAVLVNVELIQHAQQQIAGRHRLGRIRQVTAALELAVQRRRSARAARRSARADSSSPCCCRRAPANDRAACRRRPASSPACRRSTPAS